VIIEKDKKKLRVKNRKKLISEDNLNKTAKGIEYYQIGKG
jgi:hypothetical protein